MSDFEICKHNWISLEENLPDHDQTVLVLTTYGQAVCIFLDGNIIKKILKDNGKKIKNIEPYYFCSQENHSNKLNHATHWMPLPEAPK